MRDLSKQDEQTQCFFPPINPETVDSSDQSLLEAVHHYGCISFPLASVQSGRLLAIGTSKYPLITFRMEFLMLGLVLLVEAPLHDSSNELLLEDFFKCCHCCFKNNSTSCSLDDFSKRRTFAGYPLKVICRMNFLFLEKQFDESHLLRLWFESPTSTGRSPKLIETPSIIKMSVCFAFLQTQLYLRHYDREVLNHLYT